MECFFIGLEYVHPKVIYHNARYSQTVNISGVIDGVEVNEQGVDLNNYFTEITSTFGNANIDVFAGRVINIFGKNSNRGQLNLHTGAAVGLSFSSGVVNEVRDGQIIQGDRAPLRVNGVAFSTRTKLRYSFPKDKVHLTLGHDFSYNRIDGQLDNYDAKASLRSHRIHFGVGITLGRVKKKKNKKD